MAHGAAPWSVPVALDTSGALLPSPPSVAVTPAGRAVVAWWQRDGGRDVVRIRHRPGPAAPFVGPITLDRIGRDTPATPVTAVGGERVLVGWIGGRAAATRSVRLRTVPARPGEGAVATLAEGAGAEVRDLAVAMAPGAPAIAVWVRDPLPLAIDGGAGVVRVSWRPGGAAAWSAPADLSPAGGTAPAVAMAADGSGLVAWQQAGEGIRVAGLAPGGAPGAGVTVTGAAAGRRPAVGVTPAGDALLAWTDDDAVYVASRPGAGALGPPLRVSDPGGLLPAARGEAPSVGVSAQGTAIVAWRRAAGGALRVEAAAGSITGPWGAPVVLSPSGTRNTGRPAVAVSPAGAAAVVWSHPAGRSLADSRARARTAAGGAFGSVERISAAPGRGISPAVGIDARGRAVAAWRGRHAAEGAGTAVRLAVRLPVG